MGKNMRKMHNGNDGGFSSSSTVDLEQVKVKWVFV